MPRYALVKSGSFVENRTYPTKPDDIPHKGIQWLPCDPVSPPSFDPDTELVSGPTYTVNGSVVTESYTKRALTVQELDALKDAKVSAIDKVQLKIAFNHENRIRALEGKAAITQQQFLAAIKTLL